MNRRALLLALLLLWPSVSASVVAFEVHGAGRVAIEEGLVRVGPVANLQLAGRVEVDLADDTFTGATLPPLGPRPPPFEIHNRTEASWAAVGQARVALLAADVDAVLVVLPVQTPATLTADAWHASDADGDIPGGPGGAA